VGNHNHIALYAARPHKPKDKAAVENFVKITYRRIYALLRNDTFHSLALLNAKPLKRSWPCITR
jgi:transposase